MKLSSLPLKMSVSYRNRTYNRVLGGPRYIHLTKETNAVFSGFSALLAPAAISMNSITLVMNFHCILFWHSGQSLLESNSDLSLSNFHKSQPWLNLRSSRYHCKFIRQIMLSELLYIGFWTDKGNVDTKTLQLLSQLKNKQLFLFGTADFGGSDIYFRKNLIIRQILMYWSRILTVHCLTLMPMTWKNWKKPLWIHPSDKTIK